MAVHRSTQRLADYIVAVSAAADEAGAVATAVEHSARTFTADIAAVVLDGAVRGRVGPACDATLAGLVAARPGAESLALGDLGTVHTGVAELGSGQLGVLIVGRAGDPFGADERDTLSGMAHTLGMALGSRRTRAAERTLRAEYERETEERLRLLDALGVRQRLLEALLSTQRSIANRKPLQEILDAITAGAADLLNRSAVTLVLPDPHTGEPVTVATGGAYRNPGDPLVLAAATEAIDAGCVVARTGETGPRGVRSIVAAPVFVRGAATGSLTAECSDGSSGLIEQRELLAAFAQQVGLALTDARAVSAIYEAHHDRTTGLPNRAGFLDRLGQALVTANDQLTHVTALLVDLDRFKTVNESLGHRAGDQILAAVAARIRHCLRADDLVARLGSDEFGVLLTGASASAGARAARSVIDAIREPFPLDGRSVSVTASVGVATSMTSSVDAGDLLTCADVALGRAKQSGPGKIVIFEPHMHAELLERLNLLDDLHAALGGNELRLQYQPLVRLADGAPVGVEALARWRHPQRGYVSPASFIQVAEESGLIIDLGRWILREGCRQVAEWRGAVPGMGLNVNVSARQALDGEFVSDVAKALADVDLPAGMLTLELTETMLMGDPDQARMQLSQLKDLGVRLSIDDFGTGYSSLSYLRQFPVDQLKIDRAFVSGITSGGDQLAVTRLVMELGRTLRLETVAEGIENPGQLDTLGEIGCDLGQGYHLARPMDPALVPGYFEEALAN